MHRYLGGFLLRSIVYKNVSKSHFGVVVAPARSGVEEAGVAVVDPVVVEHLPLTVVLASAAQSVYDVLGAFSSVAAQMLCPLS